MDLFDWATSVAVPVHPAVLDARAAKRLTEHPAHTAKTKSTKEMHAPACLDADHSPTLFECFKAKSDGADRAASMPAVIAPPCEQPAHLPADRNAEFLLPTENVVDPAGRPMFLNDTIAPCTTFPEALAWLAARGQVDEADLRSWRFAVGSLAKMTGRPTSQLRLAPDALVPLLQKVQPSSHNITPKRWSNIRSMLVAIAKETGHHAPKPVHSQIKNANWLQFLWKIEDSPKKHLLRGLAVYCDRRQIDLSLVTEATLDGYHKWRLDTTYSIRNNAFLGELRNAWNKHIDVIPGSSIRRMVAPPNPRVQALPLSAFLKSFDQDLTAYLDNLRNPDPLNHLRNRRLTPVTIDERRRFLIRAASIVVKSGKSFEEIPDLRALVTPSNMRIVVLDLFARHGKKWSSTTVQMAIFFVDVARRWARLDEQDLEPLLQIRRMVKLDPTSMGSRNQQRLAKFDNPRILMKLGNLPVDLRKNADETRPDRPVYAAQKSERGVALALLLLLPMRRRNLEAIDFERHLERNDRGHFVRLCVPATEVKNGIELSSDIPPALARHIERHITLHRPALLGSDASTLLFPGPSGRQRAMGSLARVVAREVRAATGVAFNIHMVRHIAADLLYEDNPENGPVVQGLLAHTELKTTEAIYGVRRTRSAQRVWMSILDQKLKSIQQVRRG
jgi:integrase